MKNIFIADDDPDILDILTLMLQSQGYKVWATSDANDIFKKSTDLPDLILMDIWMSGNDGREISLRLKKNELTKDIPIIFISANSSIKEITQEYKVTDFISKPFEMDFLLNKIETILNKHQYSLSSGSDI